MNIILNLIKENVLDISILSFIVKDNNYETLSGLLKEKPKYNSDGTITFNDNTITSVKREDIKNKSLYNIQICDFSSLRTRYTINVIYTKIKCKF